MEKYLSYIKKHPYCFCLAPLFMVLEASGEFILPFLSARMIDEGAANHNLPLMLRMGALMGALALFMLICGVAGAYFAIRGSALLTHHIRCETFALIQRFSFENIDAFSSGALITRITNDITQIQSFLQMLLRGCFRSPVMILGALGMSLSLSPDLAKILLIAVAFLLTAIALLIHLASPRYLAMQGKLDGMNNYLEETIGGVKVVKGFVREEHEEERFLGVNTALREKSIRALSVTACLMPLSALVINVTTVAVVWSAGRKIMVGGMQVGTLTAFLTYLTQTLTALNFLANIFLQGTRAAASNARISQIYETRVTLTDENAREKEHAIASGEVRFEHVTFSYAGSAIPAVEDVSFTIHSGEAVGLVGSTGSGKTTLISLLPRLRDPQQGRILVDGVDVKDLSLAELRSKVGVVLQKNTLFTGSIEENLRWGKADASPEEIEKALRLSCAWEFVSAMPEGTASLLEQEGANLSGGQRQRLCIARALLGEPKILIMDDSTSAVDMATDAAIRRGLAAELPGMTKIIIAQRVTSVQGADQIIVLDRGRVEAVGRHEELLEKSKTYREIYESQRKEG